jgi:hypothetical protein
LGILGFRFEIASHTKVTDIEKSRVTAGFFAKKKTVHTNGQISGGGLIHCNVSHPGICNIMQITG